MNKIIASALVRLLRPLVRILLRNGVPFATFSDLAKWVYTDVAYREFAIAGKRQTVSRVSIITGLTRKEVKRIGELSPVEDLRSAERYNRAARVISGWLKDALFLDRDGNPLDLPFGDEAGGVSFSRLVKGYSGDVPARAILDELERAGVVESNHGHIRLRTKGYIPRGTDGEKLHILGTDVGDLIGSIDHNLICDPAEAYLQRKVFYDNIPEERIDEVKAEAARQGEAFIASMDRKMSRYDRDVNPAVEGEGRKRAVLGVYYFQE